ncbi:class I mannose-6-phosphate isomerase [Sphingomonas ginsengisoli (ex An et al. 2013)]|uniref:class I mannose-6-phosphate isomerase n=1 Tax=Sphingomonas ginsengisoli (ex An et al. 2013) TaxID=363835 RepID=UPI001269A1DE|nr:class I mannose-6-phosphate isomerase [Sphingomonas ginsengisoli An et al. 2013]
MKLAACLSEKPWGQVDVPWQHRGANGVRIGEVAFRHPAGAELPVLIKYLYTSERLSIQVHPDNAQARAVGHPCGKDEMWIVLAAEPGATIGLGLKQSCEPAQFASAVRDGSVVDLLDWKPVARGDVIYNRAGTIHAAGAGLVLLEVQQSADLTYRLFDYGRPRELHLDEGLRVAYFGRHDSARDGSVADRRSRILADGPYFGAAWCVGAFPVGLPTTAAWQVVVVSGSVRHQGLTYQIGQALCAASLEGLDLPGDAELLLAWPVQAALAQAA